MNKKNKGPERQRLPANERWEQILDAAAELFAAKGFHGTSLDDIGEQLGVQKTALYHYVRSKDDILVEIYDRMLREAEQQIFPIAKLPLPPDERMRRIVTRYVELILKDAAMWSLVHYQQNALPEPHKTNVLRRKRVFERTLEGVIQEGQAAGLFKPITPRLLTLAIFGMCNFVHYWIQFVRYPVDQITGALCELVERGLTETGEGRTGAWPRAAAPGEALVRTAAEILDLKGRVERLATTFDRERQCLDDGLLKAPLAQSRARSGRRRGANR